VKLCIRLEIVKGPATGKIFSHVVEDDGQLQVGRSESSDVWLPKSDVSRKHCTLTNRNGQVELIDQASNPSGLNGMPIQGATLLRDDDVLTIGPFHLHVSIHKEGSLLYGAPSSAGEVDLADTLIGEAQAPHLQSDGIVDATGSFTQISPHENQVYDGYRVSHPIGQGSTGEVFKAIRETDQQVFALKIIRASFPSSPEVSERFAREITLLRQLDHPRIMRIYGNGVILGQQYMVCELLHGRTLDAVLKQRTTLTEEIALSIASQLVDGLSFAAERGIIHRDINPNNIFVSNQDGELAVKLIDFGLGKQDDGSAITADGAGLGTPGYMAPELVSDANSADLRSDIFGLGGVIFRIVSGRPPQLARTMREFIQEISQDVPSLGQVAPDSSAPLISLVDRCLRFDTDQRFQTYAELRDEIELLQR